MSGGSAPAGTVTHVEADNDTEWLTSAQMAEVLMVSDDTIRKWRCRGEFPGAMTLPNGSIRIHRKDVELWLQGRAA